MFCKKCGTDLGEKPEVRFCPGCGEPVSGMEREQRSRKEDFGKRRRKEIGIALAIAAGILVTVGGGYAAVHVKRAGAVKNQEMVKDSIWSLLVVFFSYLLYFYHWESG